LFAWSRAGRKRADAQRSFSGERNQDVVELARGCVVPSKREAERKGERTTAAAALQGTSRRGAGARVAGD
jgi:hypothetical protein